MILAYLIFFFLIKEILASEGPIVQFSQFVDIRALVVTNNLEDTNTVLPTFRIWAQSEVFLNAGIFINFTIVDVVLDHDLLEYGRLGIECAAYNRLKDPAVNLIILNKPIANIIPVGAAVLNQGCIWVQAKGYEQAGEIFAHELGHIFLNYVYHNPRVSNPSFDCPSRAGNLMQKTLTLGTPRETSFLPCGRIPIVPRKYLVPAKPMDYAVKFTVDYDKFIRNARLYFKQSCEKLAADEFCYNSKKYAVGAFIDPPKLDCGPLKLTQNINRAYNVSVFTRACTTGPFKVAPENLENLKIFRENYVYISKNAKYRQLYEPPLNHTDCKTDACVINCKDRDTGAETVTNIPTGDTCDDDDGICVSGSCVRLSESNYVFYNSVRLSDLSITNIKSIAFTTADQLLIQILDEFVKINVPYFSRVTKNSDNTWKLRLGGARMLKLVGAIFKNSFVLNSVTIQKFEHFLIINATGSECTVEPYPLLPCFAVDWYFL